MRSFMSAFAATVLWATGYKRKVTGERSMARYMAKCRAISAKPYHIPSYCRMKARINKSECRGMEVFRLKAESEGAKAGGVGKTVLYFHGGGYVEQPLPFHWLFLDELARKTGATVIAPVYPKAPDHVYIETYACLTELYDRILQTTTVENVILMGDSSGGGLALAFAQYLQQIGKPQPSKLILLSPWVDLTMSNEQIKEYERFDPTLSAKGLIVMAEAWAGGDSPRNYMLSPLYGDMRGLGAISLFIGGNEVLLPDAKKLRTRAAEQGVKIDYYEYPKMNHVFPLYPVPEATIAKHKIFDIVCE